MNAWKLNLPDFMNSRDLQVNLIKPSTLQMRKRGSESHRKPEPERGPLGPPAEQSWTAGA